MVRPPRSSPRHGFASSRRKPDGQFAIQPQDGEGFVEALPLGLDTVVGDRGMRLSGGERQRLALARALLRNPDLLILDEATSALDIETERVIRDALAALRTHTTILLISHRPSTVSWADEIVRLKSGQVVESTRGSFVSA